MALVVQSSNSFHLYNVKEIKQIRFSLTRQLQLWPADKYFAQKVELQDWPFGFVGLNGKKNYKDE